MNGPQTRRGVPAVHPKPMALQLGRRGGDDIERLLGAFFAGRGPNTADAYQRSIHEFCEYVLHVTGTHTGLCTPEQHNRALRFFYAQPGATANEIAHHYQQYLLSRNLSTASVSRHMYSLRALTKMARVLGVASWQIEIPVVRIEARTRDTKGPTLDVVRALLTEAPQQPAPFGVRDVAMIRLMVDLGLRVAEVTRLDLDDLQPGGIWVLGKGRREKELLQVPKTTRDALEAWVKVHPKTSRQLMMTFSPSRQGKRLTPHGVQKILRVLSGRVGTHVRPHGLRHTAITTAIDAAAANGLSIDVVRQFSRHKSIGTLLIYRDLHENKQGQIAEYVAATVDEGASA